MHTDTDMKLVHQAAKYVHRRVKEFEEYDSLVSAGWMGLLAARKAWSEEMGVEWEPYAINQIRRAIWDDLRNHDHLPKKLRAKLRRIRSAEDRLRQELHRDPTDLELADELRISLEQLFVWQMHTLRDTDVHLDHPRWQENRAKGAAFASSKEKEELLRNLELLEDVERRLEVESEFGRVERVLKLLKTHERLALTEYYGNGKTNQEIARELGMNEASLSRCRTRVMERVQKALAA